MKCQRCHARHERRGRCPKKLGHPQNWGHLYHRPEEDWRHGRWPGADPASMYARRASAFTCPDIRR